MKLSQASSRLRWPNCE